MSGSPRPRYFLVRSDGILTPLVAVDELPASIRILGVPAVLSCANTQGMISLGVAARSEHRYILESSTFSSSNGTGTPSSCQPAMTSRPDTAEEHAKASNGGVLMDETSHIQHGCGTPTSSSNAAVLVPGHGGQQVEAWRQGVPNGVDEIQVRPDPSLPGPCQLTPPQATVDAIVNAASCNGTATADATTTASVTKPHALPIAPSSQFSTPSSDTSNNKPAILPPTSSAPTTTTTTVTTLPPTTSNPTSPTPSTKKKEKVYCSFWIRRGECDYTQQGCLYKHEMPNDRETLRELGISMVPRWWREANAVRVGGSGWSERAGLGAGKEKEKGMWRVGAGAPMEKGQGGQGSVAQAPVMQTHSTLPPPQVKAMEETRTSAAAQPGGQLFATPGRAAPVAVTPASSMAGMAFSRQMMGSRYSSPAATHTPVLAATTSPSFSLAPAPAPAYRQQYNPATPNGHGSQTPAPSPVGTPQTGSRFSPPSAAARIPEPSSAEGTSPTAPSENDPLSSPQSIPIPSTPTATPPQSALPSHSPPAPMLLPTYQPLTPSSPHRQSSASSPSPIPQPRPVSALDVWNGVPAQPQVHRRLFVTPGQSQFVTMAPTESGLKESAQDEAVKRWDEKPKRTDAGEKNGVLVEFGEG